MNQRDSLTARQLVVISHLIASPSVEEACRRAKISKPTVYAWFKDEAFRSEPQRQKEIVYEESLENLKAGAKRAVERLLKLVGSQKEEIAIRACAQIISANLKLKEIDRPEKKIVYDTPFSIENLRRAWEEIEAEKESAKQSENGSRPVG